MFRYPQIVMQLNPKLEKEFAKIILKYYDEFANAGWWIAIFKTNIVEEWREKSPKGDHFYKDQRFLDHINHIGTVSVLVAAAQKDGFDMYRDAKDMDTIWIQIKPKRYVYADFDSTINKGRSDLTNLLQQES